MGEVDARTGPDPSLNIHPCPRPLSASVVDVALLATNAAAKRFVDVAFVEVLFTMSRFVMVVEAALTRMPLVKERSVDVALLGNGHELPAGHVAMHVSPVRQRVDAEKAVEEAYGSREAVVDVATT